MKSNTSEEERQIAVQKEIDQISAHLEEVGFTLDVEQPHIGGERFLMSKEKYVLVGSQIKSKSRVVLKVSNKENGKKDISKEKSARDLLKSVVFTDESILFPDELYYGERGGYLIWVIAYIDQAKVFCAHTLEEQFFLALKAFEVQEALHATTYEHLKTVEKVFPILHAREYFSEFALSRTIFEQKVGDAAVVKTLKSAEEFLRSHKITIDTHCNYLTHTDFVPHNFRVKDGSIYMIDCAPEYRTVHFGNKYEGWARFINYMIQHNPDLEKILTEYIRKNRGEDEYLSLRLMRVYKAGFLLRYYAESLENTSGDLRELTLRRITFWHHILQALLADRPVPAEEVEAYKQRRDTLRSEEEKKRQLEFSVF